MDTKVLEEIEDVIQEVAYSTRYVNYDNGADYCPHCNADEDEPHEADCVVSKARVALEAIEKEEGEE